MLTAEERLGSAEEERPQRPARLFAPAAAPLRSLVFGAAVVLLLASPMLLTDKSFGADFTNALWLGSVQARTITHAGLFPSFFTNTTGTRGTARTFSLFEPIFAFYGGTLFGLLGWLSVLLGTSTVAAFELLTTAFIAMAYGGFYWLSRQAGLNRALSHAAPLTYVGSAYYATDLYGRADWPELAATSAMVLAVAAALALVREPTVRLRTWLACFLATVLWAGSHNVTMLLSASFLVLLAILSLVLWRGPLPSPGRLWRVVPPVALGAAVNGWYLLPDLLYGSRTRIAHTPVVPVEFFDTLANMLDPFRAVPSASTTPGLYTQLPVWMLGWGLLAAGVGLVATRGRPSLGRTSLLVVLCWLAAALWLLLEPGAWDEIPPLLQQVQFAYRFTPYADAAGAALVLAALALLRSEVARERLGRRRLLQPAGAALLAGVLAMTLGLQVWQLWVPNVQQHSSDPALARLNADRSLSLNGLHTLPASWYASFDYGDESTPSINLSGARSITFSAADLNAAGDSLTETVDPPNGFAPIDTNLTAGPYLITVKGMKDVGEASAHVVLERSGRRTGPVTVTITTAGSFGVRAGRLLSILGALCLLALAGLRAARWRTRRGRPAAELLESS